MRLDAPTLARAWLAVAQASAAKDDAAALTRTIAVEEYPTGIRLVATDRFLLLMAWVPDLDARHGHEPLVDEAPDRTVVVRDGDGRGKGLMGYVLTLASRESLADEPAGSLEVDVTFDARLPAGSEGTDATLEGMDPSYVILAVPDRERVWLPVVEDRYPEWRSALAGHARQATDTVRFQPEFVHRLTGVRRWAAGPVEWVFGGADRVALVSFPESDPRISGAVMPSRWETAEESGHAAAGDEE